MNTLLRYPGGKSRAVKILNSYLPEGIGEIVSPFFGGGSFEIDMAKNGIRVYGYDSFDNLVIFWQRVLKDPAKLAEAIRGYYPLDRETFYRMQKAQSEEMGEIEKAASFYVLNRCSFSGSTLSGGMSPGHPRFNENSIKRIEDFKVENLTVEKMDFKESITKNPDKFLYCDPPYLIDSNLYGTKGDKHKDFDHEGLAELLKSRNGWILSYNNSDYIKELYAGYEFVYPEWAYGMNKDKKSKEILILNY